MKDIERLKKEYLDKFAKKYYNESPQNLVGDSFYRCSILAEMWAYMKVILPRDVARYTIFDFDGISKDKKVELIPTEIALNAKNLISLYCWGKSWKEIKDHFKEDDGAIRKWLNNNSSMMNRLHNGNNIVIHGDSIDHPIGRTMVASLVMKEAIKLRAQPGQRGQNYEWIDFMALKDELNLHSKNKNSRYMDYRSCSWLVVDNIFQPEYWTIQMKEYLSGVIDSFFLNRLNDGLPTIFVFKFDIRKTSFNAEEDMGTGISRIIHNRATCKIPLCEDFKAKYE